MKICIVGGGLAGLATVIVLSKALTERSSDDVDNNTTNNKDRNYTDVVVAEIVVVEKRDFSSRGATLSLALNGQAALQELCPTLLEELKAIGISLSTGGYIMLPWYRLRDGLLEHARNSKNVTIVTNRSFIGAEDQVDGRVLVTLEETVNHDGTTTETTTTMEVDVLIGADGINSRVRQLIGAPPAVSSKTKCWRDALNDLPPHLLHALDISIAKVVKTETGWLNIFNFHTSFPGFVSWEVSSKNLDAVTPLETMEGMENEEDFKTAKDLFAASTQQELEYSTILSTTSMQEETGWGGKGQFTLIGDAAHAMRPASGLGGSLALEDAVVLARCIAKCGSSDKRSICDALRDFESRRFLRCKTIVDDQTRVAESGYGKLSNILKWTPEYEKWVFTGPDAVPKPPDKMYIGDSVTFEENRQPATKVFKGKVVHGLSLMTLIVMVFASMIAIVNGQEQQNPMTLNGGSLLAMAGEGCVAMAVDKRFGSGPQMVTIAPRHVWSPHANLMLGFVGLEGDVRSLSEDLKIEVANKRNRSLGFGTNTAERRISPPALASVTSHLLWNKRSYFVEPLVVGLMEKTGKPFLCAMDMIGAQSFSKSFICAGAASESLYGTAEALWNPNLGPEELANVCGKAFQSALERDCLSGYGILVYLITKDGITEFDLATRND